MIEISNILEVKNYVGGLKAVVFDLDDTLYGEKEYVRSGYKKIAELFPMIADVELRLWKLFEAGKAAIDEFMKEESIQSDEIRQDCINAYRYQIPDIHLYEGVQIMLNEFKTKGFKIGIITDGRPEGQRAKIKALELEPMVDYIIVTDEFGGPEFRKPNPIAFETMRNKLDIEYAEMCYVGDNISKDFLSPEKLGMKCIWFKNKDGLYYVESNR